VESSDVTSLSVVVVVSVNALEVSDASLVSADEDEGTVVTSNTFSLELSVNGDSCWLELSGASLVSSDDDDDGEVSVGTSEVTVDGSLVASVDIDDLEATLSLVKTLDNRNPT